MRLAVRAAASLLALTTALAAASCSPGSVTAVGLPEGTLWNGLVAHYTFDDRTGNVLPDHSGLGRDGDLHGPSWVDDGRFGGALRIDYGTFVTVPDFPDATASWTVAVWIRLPAPGASARKFATVMSTESDLIGGWQLNVTAGPAVHFAFWTGPGTYDYAWAEAPVTYEQWIHVAGVVDGKEKLLTLYVDGRPRVRKSIPHPILPGVRSLSIGTWSGTIERFFVGMVDDAIIFSRALAEDEIQALTDHAVPDPQ